MSTYINVHIHTDTQAGRECRGTGPSPDVGKNRDNDLVLCSYGVPSAPDSCISTSVCMPEGVFVCVYL